MHTKFKSENQDQDTAWKTHTYIHTWQDNIKMNVKLTECEGVDCVHQAQDRDQFQACEYGNEPSAFLKARKSRDYLSDY
jgi:hypothetical protein